MELGRAPAFSDGEDDGRERDQQHLVFGMFYYASALYAVMASGFAALDGISHTIFRVIRLLLRKVTNVFRFYDSL